jgi:hypothetical protein
MPFKDHETVLWYYKQAISSSHDRPFHAVSHPECTNPKLHHFFNTNPYYLALLEANRDLRKAFSTLPYKETSNAVSGSRCQLCFGYLNLGNDIFWWEGAGSCHPECFTNGAKKTIIQKQDRKELLIKAKDVSIIKETGEQNGWDEFGYFRYKE